LWEQKGKERCSEGEKYIKKRVKKVEKTLEEGTRECN
jgi:hypothetical protein